jgi:hypothetical protein
MVQALVEAGAARQGGGEQVEGGGARGEAGGRFLRIHRGAMPVRAARRKALC